MDDSNEMEVQEQPAQHVVYCGPTLPPEYGLTKYQIFIGGFPAHVQQALGKFPEIKSLFVPVRELAQTRLNLERPGSVEAAQYQEAVAAIRAAKGGK